MFYVFFKTICVVHLGYVEKEDDITGQYYENNCLAHFILEINKQRPVTGTQNLKFIHDNVRPHVTQNVKRTVLNTFDKRLERKQLCIDNDGHYYEHLIKYN